MKKKILVACLCVALAVLTVAGTTLAYLTSKTNEVKNTFTVGKVNIELWEHQYVPETNTLNDTKLDGSAGKTGNDYKIIPGVDLPKDPTVVVKAGSEDCWLFVKVDAQNWPANQKISYTFNTAGWTKLTGVEGVDNVYYREMADITADQTIELLTGNKVTVSEDLTMDEINAFTEAQKTPTLAFTAYAIQKAGFTTAAAAWAEVGN